MLDKEELYKIAEKIVKECFWDYNHTPESILKLTKNGSIREKQKLFSRIMYNSTNSYRDLKIFDDIEIRTLFDSFRPNFNDSHVRMMTLAMRNIMFNERNIIKGLQWKK